MLFSPAVLSAFTLARAKVGGKLKARTAPFWLGNSWMEGSRELGDLCFQQKFHHPPHLAHMHTHSLLGFSSRQGNLLSKIPKYQSFFQYAKSIHSFTWQTLLPYFQEFTSASVPPGNAFWWPHGLTEQPFLITVSWSGLSSYLPW